jgi:dienelactone hydrolase
MTQRLARAACAIASLFALALPASPQASFSAPARVVKPSGYDPAKAYPLIILCAPTGNTAEETYDWEFRGAHEGLRALVLLPAGRFEAKDYLPDFSGFVARYEAMLLREIAAAKRAYKIDEGRIGIAGHSLGGDLAWALNARNPKLFSGILVSGSRCSYPVKAADLAVMAERGFRAAFVMGARDDAERLKGNTAARAALMAAGIKLRYVEAPGAAHSDIPRSAMLKNFAWAMGIIRIRE